MVDIFNISFFWYASYWGLIAISISIWWWIKIAEARGRPGWWGVLIVIPLVNFVIIGILAWGSSVKKTI